MVHVRQHGVAEHLPVPRNAAHRHAAEVDAVVASLAPDELDPGTFPARPVPAQRNLQGGIDGLRAGIGEEHVVEPVRGKIDDFFRQFERPGMAHLEGRGIIQFCNLFLHCLDDFGMAMTQGPVLHRPEKESRTVRPSRVL